MAISSDEGEILEHGGDDSKATSLPYAERSGVDRPDRHHARASSPQYDSRSRDSRSYDSRPYDSRSTYNGSTRRSRSPLGYGRPRDNRDYQHYDRRDRNPRHNGSRYESSHRDSYRRSRVTYEDLDRPPSRASDHNYDAHYRDRDRDRNRDHDRDRDRNRNRDVDRYRDRSRERDHNRDARDRYGDQRDRNRSRSPHQPHQNGAGRDHVAKEVQHDQADDTSTAQEYEAFKPRKRRSVTFHDYITDDTGFSTKTNFNGDSSALRKRKIPAEPEPELDWEPPVEIDVDAEIERRRKRRAEIMAKSSSATPLLLHAVGAAEKTRSSTPGSTQSPTLSLALGAIDGPATPLSNVASPMSPASVDASTPGGIGPLNDSSLINAYGNGQVGEDEGPSAADYDPTADMKEDERRDELRHGQVVLHGEPHAVKAPVQQSVEETKAANDDDDIFDMFADAPVKQSTEETEEATNDDDNIDMFADVFDAKKFESKTTKTTVPIESGATVAAPQANAQGGMLDTTDKDGFYKSRIGEVLVGRYQITGHLGKGMFASVVQALDHTTQKEVAVKIMRHNDALRKGGYTEIAILKKLNEADPGDRKHLVRFGHSFSLKGHICMTFELLDINLREVLRKFGKESGTPVGISLYATREYARQIFVALVHMRKCSIIHADLKPDNILVNKEKTSLKVCDLGTAIDRSDAATAQHQITPYLVSRFYRAPEIILGMPYDYAVDVWSIGCTLYELYTGKILFVGESNNQMLRVIMEVCGKITKKVYKRGELSPRHFNASGQFISVKVDKFGKSIVRTLNMGKPDNDLRSRLLSGSKNMSADELTELQHFIDLLEQCLVVNPEKRITAADALRHPFFTDRPTAKPKETGMQHI